MEDVLLFSRVRELLSDLYDRWEAAKGVRETESGKGRNATAEMKLPEQWECANPDYETDCPVESGEYECCEECRYGFCALLLNHENNRKGETR